MAAPLNWLGHVRRPVAANQRIDDRNGHALGALLQLVGAFTAQQARDRVPVGDADLAGEAPRLGCHTLARGDVVDGDAAAFPVRWHHGRARRDEQVEACDPRGALLPVDGHGAGELGREVHAAHQHPQCPDERLAAHDIFRLSRPARQAIERPGVEGRSVEHQVSSQVMDQLWLAVPEDCVSCGASANTENTGM
ncbi:hypothetical protein D3C77_533380 [compost metagenome]